MKGFAGLLSLGALAGVMGAPLVLNEMKVANVPLAWYATNYTQGCGNAGCVYSFTLSHVYANTSDYAEPGFTTFCNGTNIQNEMVPCEDPSVTTNSLPGISNETILIQHKWYQNLTGGPDAGVGIFWIKGNTTVVGYPFPTSFEVPQYEAFAIA